MAIGPTTTPRQVVRNPAICGGAPTIAGTRVPVTSIAVSYALYRDLNLVHSAYPQVDVPSIQAALAFYDAHRTEIDELIEQDEREAFAVD